MKTSCVKSHLLNPDFNQIVLDGKKHCALLYICEFEPICWGVSVVSISEKIDQKHLVIGSANWRYLGCDIRLLMDYLFFPVWRLYECWWAPQLVMPTITCLLSQDYMFHGIACFEIITDDRPNVTLTHDRLTSYCSQMVVLVTIDWCCSHSHPSMKMIKIQWSKWIEIYVFNTLGPKQND